jgi:lipid-binding SYLF domain-containing protein
LIGSVRIVRLALVLGLVVGCSTAPRTQEGKDDLVRQAAAALSDWNRQVPGIESFARGSYGYVMFPGIGKGGAGIGAAYGRGVVYAEARHIGFADVSQGSLGLLIGGQSYQELIVFDDKAALERFKQGQFDLSADSTAVLIAPGYTGRIRFIEGVTVLFRPVGGLMAEATVSGQRFTFVDK